MEAVPRTYTGLSRLAGPIIVIERVEGVSYGEVVQIEMPGGDVRDGRVLDVTKDHCVIQSFEGTHGLSTRDTRVRFMGRPLLTRVSEEMLGRVFDGLQNPFQLGYIHLRRHLPNYRPSRRSQRATARNQRISRRP